MGVVGLGVLAASALKPRTDRVFFYITAAINLTACIAYFTMGSNLGWTPIDVEWVRAAGSKIGGTNREIFYVRYIDWFITTPLLLMDLLLTAGLPWPTIVWTIFLDWAMIITGLVGALVKSRYKWGYYAFGNAAMFYIFWQLAIEGRKHAKHLGNDVHRVYVACGVLTLFIWLLYPIAWGLCEGGNAISSDGEAIFYSVLDFLAKPVFSIMLIAGHWSIDPGRMGLKLRDYNSDPDYFQYKNPQDKREHEANGDTNGVSGRTTGTDAA
jgi:bacteriorhodopsin